MCLSFHQLHLHHHLLALVYVCLVVLDTLRDILLALKAAQLGFVFFLEFRHDQRCANSVLVWRVVIESAWPYTLPASSKVILSLLLIYELVERELVGWIGESLS